MAQNRQRESASVRKRRASAPWFGSGVFYWNQAPATGKLRADLAQEEVTRASKIGATHIGYFVDLDGLMIYPSRYVPQDLRLAGRDLLGEIVSEAGTKGMRVVAAWMGMHVQTYLAQQHPDWRLVGLQKSFWLAQPQSGGEAHGSDASDVEGRLSPDLMGSTLCINSPFRSVLLGQLEEVLSRYEVDGIYLDGLYFPEPFCFCQYCRQKYRELFGEEMPVTLLDPRREELREESLVSVAREVRQIIDRTRPDAAFFLDCHGTIIGTIDSRECIHKTCRYVDAYMLECYPELISERPDYVGMETDLVRAETKKGVISPKWIAWNPDRALVPLPPAGLRIWAWQAVMHGAPPVFLDQRVTDFSPHVVKLAGEIFADVEKVQGFLAGSRRPRYAALLHSMETKFRTLPYQPREHRRYFEGWWTVLQGTRIPFDVITEEDILSGVASEYRALVLPNVRCMSPTVAKAIEAFVKGGGGLVLTGESSLEDENGERRSDFALGDVAGIRFEEVSTTEDRFGRALTHYYRVAERHPISTGLAGATYGLAASERMAYVEAQTGTQAIFRLTAYDEELARSDRFFVSYPTDVLREPVLLCREDKGRVVSIPAPLDATYWEFGWPEIARILSRSVVWAARKKPPFTVDAPPCVHAAFFEGDTSVLLMLLNVATNLQYSIGFPGAFVHRTEGLNRSQLVQYVVPVADLVATLRLPQRPKRVISVTGREFEWSYVKGKLSVRVPRLLEHEAIAATF